MKWNRMTRRHFLQGAGNTMLALPFLESLAPKYALAQTAPQLNFIGVAGYYGEYRISGKTSQLMPPSLVKNGGLTTLGGVAFNQIAGTGGSHAVHWKLLSELAAANGGKISDLIDTKYNPYLSKMNLTMGIDHLAALTSHHYGMFGGWHTADNGAPPMASLDQVLAYSPTFYKNAALRGRSVVYCAASSDTSEGTSFTFADPSNMKSSAINRTSSVFFNPATLWDRYFAGQGTVANPFGSLLVSKVRSDYQSLLNNRKLGSEDKSRLKRHYDLLAVTEQEVNAVKAVCGELRPATNFADRSLILKAINSVNVSLMACGLAHTFLAHATATSISANWDDAHNWSHEGLDGETDQILNQTTYDKLLRQHRLILEDICLDLTQKLDAVGLLGNSLILWVQEHNKKGHEGVGVPTMMFGGAGGAFTTGKYIDYCNKAMTAPDECMPGYPMNQLFSNVLQAMGLPVTEIEALNRDRSSAGSAWKFKPYSGYGPNGWSSSDNRVFTNYNNWTGYNMSQILPGLKA